MGLLFHIADPMAELFDIVKIIKAFALLLNQTIMQIIVDIGVKLWDLSVRLPVPLDRTDSGT